MTLAIYRVSTARRPRIAAECSKSRETLTPLPGSKACVCTSDNAEDSSTKSASKTLATSSDSTVSILDSTLKISEKTIEQTQLDLLSTVTAVETYALPSSPEWNGVHESTGSARGHLIDKVNIYYSADPILTME